MVIIGVFSKFVTVILRLFLCAIKNLQILTICYFYNSSWRRFCVVGSQRWEL